jgi:hypothetical protein
MLVPGVKHGSGSTCREVVAAPFRVSLAQTGWIYAARLDLAAIRSIALLANSAIAVIKLCKSSQYF